MVDKLEVDRGLVDIVAHAFSERALPKGLTTETVERLSDGVVIKVLERGEPRFDVRILLGSPD